MPSVLSSMGLLAVVISLLAAITCIAVCAVPSIRD